MHFYSPENIKEDWKEDENKNEEEKEVVLYCQTCEDGVVK